MNEVTAYKDKLFKRLKKVVLLRIGNYKNPIETYNLISATLNHNAGLIDEFVAYIDPVITKLTFARDDEEARNIIKMEVLNKGGAL